MPSRILRDALLVSLPILFTTIVTIVVISYLLPPKEGFSPTTPVPSTIPATMPLPTASSQVLSSSTPPIAPQGKIVFTCQVHRDRRFNQICIMDADGSNPRQLTDNEEADHFFASLAPDGKSVVFSSNLNEKYQIYEMDLEGNMRLLSNMGDAYAPEISPSGEQIVFTLHDGTRQSIWLMQRDGGNPARLTDPSQGSAWDPVWSPDGGEILFASDRSGDIQLYRMEGDGSNIRRLTTMGGLRGRNDWSSSGTKIATYAGSSWNWEIYVIDLGTGIPQQITDGGNNLAPSFSPDGGWLTFTSYLDNYRDDNGCEIYVMRVDGTEISRLTDNNYCDWQPRWGP